MGEKEAKNAGFNSLPICCEKLLEKNEIEFVLKPPEIQGVSGGIIFHPSSSDVTIFCSTSINNEGFKNFTIGHELGHYFIPKHQEEISASNGIHVSRAGFSEGNNSIELEADHFSAGLLMPSYLVQKHLGRSNISLDSIIELAELAKTSLTAAAIRATKCAEEAIGMVVSFEDEVAYSFISYPLKAFRPKFIRKGSKLPHTSTRNFNNERDNILYAKRVCGRTTFREWFGGNHNFALDEEIIGLGKYGLTLTLLTSDQVLLDPYEDIDEEAELEKSWTPKFAYGR